MVSLLMIVIDYPSTYCIYTYTPNDYWFGETLACGKLLGFDSVGKHSKARCFKMVLARGSA